MLSFWTWPGPVQTRTTAIQSGLRRYYSRVMDRSRFDLVGGFPSGCQSAMVQYHTTYQPCHITASSIQLQYVLLHGHGSFRAV
jgi:hypothetical protein